MTLTDDWPELREREKSEVSELLQDDNWDRTSYMIFGKLRKNDSRKTIVDNALIKTVNETKLFLDEK